MNLLACPLIIIDAGLCLAGSCDSIIGDFAGTSICSVLNPDPLSAINVSAAIDVCIWNAAVVAAAVVDNEVCIPTAVDSNEGAIIAVAGNVVVFVAAGADTAIRTAGIVGWSGKGNGATVVQAIVRTTFR